jgi:hypothetical protein
VREGDGWATGTPYGLATSMHNKAPRQDEKLDNEYKYSTNPQDFTSSLLEVEPSVKTPEA